MLRVVGVCSADEEQEVHTDVYVPISITFGAWQGSIEPTVYWRTGDFKRSLIETGIASQSGILRSVTLTLATDIVLDRGRCLDPAVPRTDGVPVLALDDWPEDGFRDEAGMLQVHLGANRLCVAFSTIPLSEAIVHSRVRFGLDNQGYLHAIEVGDLRAEEVEPLRVALLRYRAPAAVPRHTALKRQVSLNLAPRLRCMAPGDSAR